MALTLYQSEVVENQKLNNKFHLIRFKVNDQHKDSFIFSPGQFVTLKVSDSTFRAYSIITLPQILPFWDLFIDITPGGPGTKMLRMLKPKDVIESTAPKGLFIPKKDNSNYYIMIATGCGLASLKPKIEQLLTKKNKHIHLIWGLRNPEDICLTNFLDEWKKINPHFNYELIISKPNQNWKGKRGHVTEHALELALKLKNTESSFYICGNTQMIQTLNVILKKIGFPEEKIYFERHY